MNYKKQQFNTQAIKKSIPSEVLDRLDNFNRGVLEYFRDGIKPSTPKLNISSNTRDYLRIYITKGVTMMSECIDNPNSIVVIMGNMKFIRKEKRFRFDALFARPFGKTHDLDTFEFPDLNDAKGWVRCAILARRDNIELSMATHWFANKLLPFSTTKFDESTLTPEFHEAYVESLWRDRSNIKVDSYMRFCSKDNTESPIKLKDHELSFVKSKDHKESSIKSKDHEGSLLKSKHHEETSVKSKNHEETKSKHHEDSRVKSKDREGSHVKLSKNQESSGIDVFLTEQPSPSEQIASSNHKSAPEKVITVEQIKQEPNDDIIANDEKEKTTLPKKFKRTRRSNRETYAYLNLLPKRRTRQQSQSEWNLPHDLLSQVSQRSPQPKRQKSEKPIEREKPIEHEKPMERERPMEREKPLEREKPIALEKPVITKSIEPEVSKSKDQVTPTVSRKRGPYKPRKIDIQKATIRRSARQVNNKKEIVVTSNDNDKLNVKREKVYIKQEFEDGQNLSMVEEKVVNECSMEVDQLVDQESNGQEIPLFLEEEVEVINESNDLETSSQNSTPEPKGIWYNIKNAISGWVPFGNRSA
ncbi:hypothetical protein C2G38_406267 [Gigaspora rosea]|uniref:Uncharacterized protein n=1 Tax=Gigaspora rosea TaxID=44941 RepID=A0A397UBU9_9GLOM|nr:hypothetical protein C2G38_406267 [Gigaspora rosea]